MIARLRGDIEDKLEPGQPSQDEVSKISRRWLISNHIDLELREFYYETELELELSQTYLTIGKQQIVWGKADGLKVLDVVNPMDFREFILDDFDDSRIPLWTINAEIPINDSLLQLIWIPDQTYNILPESDALYAFTSPCLIPAVPPGVAIDLQSLDKPDHFFSDADYGIRLTSFVAGWDLSLNYLYHYNDNPVLFRTLTLGKEPKVTITPTYKRSHLLGGTFSNAFGDFVLRGEIGYSTDQYFLTDNIRDHDGVIKSDELSYVIGLDWSGIEDTFLSVQLFQSHLMQESSGLIRDSLIRDKVETTMTLLARQDFINETIEAEVLWLHNTNNKDGLIRPKISYEWKDDVNVWLGLDIFYGDEKGLFGQFDHKDRFIIGVEWGF
ncbi:MAG: hypothetical protein GQ546_04750 [Gammaproteobacteria bacterium]|nr:hypothetical protein [Gammaproteobacteria bacterium]